VLDDEESEAGCAEEVFAGEEAEDAGSGTFGLATTQSDAGSRAEKRICGTPHAGQKGALSSTVAPHPWQVCSTGNDYRRRPLWLKAG